MVSPRNRLYLWLAGAGLLFAAWLLFAFQFETWEGGADNYVHYRISRWSWQHPHLFLDHWGKPVFTLLSSPFAQAGIRGIVVFNGLCAFLTAFVMTRIARHLGLRFSWAAAFFTLATPIYFTMMASAMTEVLFSLVLAVSLWLYLEKKYQAAALLFSFLFLVRTEGFILYPGVALLLALKKEWRALALLTTGFMFYGAAGEYYFGDFYWLINQNPYHDTSALYGTGEWYWFLKKSDEIFGWPLCILIAGGLLIAGRQALRTLTRERQLPETILWIEGSLLLYFAAHSWAWYSGGGASAGFIRVMAAVAPLAAVTALRSLDFAAGKWPRAASGIRMLTVVGCAALFVVPLTQRRWPLHYNPGEKTMEAAADWFHQSEYRDAKVYYFDPVICYFIGRDPFDRKVNEEQISDKSHPENTVQPGEVVFFDMNFGPYEGKMQVEQFLHNPHFRLVNYFEPLTEMTVHEDQPYCIFVFLRTEPQEQQNVERLKSLVASKTKMRSWMKGDAPIPFKPDEFTGLAEVPLSQAPGFGTDGLVRARAQCRVNPGGEASEVHLVFSLGKNEKSLFYESKIIPADSAVHELQITTRIPKEFTGEEIAKIYIWNRSRNSGEILNWELTTLTKVH